MVGVGPLGCIPFVRATNLLLASGKCSVKVNGLIKGYNKKLNTTLDRLNQQLGPETIFVYANSYDVFQRIMLNHRQYGSPKSLSLIFRLIIALLFLLIFHRFNFKQPTNLVVIYLLTGFEKADKPCCGGYSPPFVCIEDRNANKSSRSALCEDRSKYVFWDAYHPTEAANIIIAKVLLDGDKSNSFPMNIRELYNHKP